MNPERGNRSKVGIVHDDICEVSYEDCMEALNKLIDNMEYHRPPSKYYYTLGTMGQIEAGISNKQVIDFFKDDSNVILIDHNGQKWCKGEKL